MSEDSTSGLNDVTSGGNSGSDDTTTPQTSSSLQTPRGVSDDEFVLDRCVAIVFTHFTIMDFGGMWDPTRRLEACSHFAPTPTIFSARVRSTTGRYCFHRCLSVHGGRGDPNQDQDRVPPPLPSTPSEGQGISPVRTRTEYPPPPPPPRQEMPRTGYTPREDFLVLAKFLVLSTLPYSFLNFRNTFILSLVFPWWRRVYCLVVVIAVKPGPASWCHRSYRTLTTSEYQRYHGNG